jgi:hypothetical protein
MTAIDPQSDIEIRTADGQVTVTVPLDRSVDDEWIQHYRLLAEATHIPAYARAGPDRAWIVVRLPTGSDQIDVPTVMDAARSLITKADTAATRTSTTTPAENSVREWWAGSRIENRWPIAVTLALAVVVQLLLPSRFSLGPRWIVPAVEAVLLAGIVVVDRAHVSDGPTLVRTIITLVVAVVVADAAGVTVRLITDLIEGGPETNSPTELLGIGFGVWIYTIIAFAFLYWRFDGGGSTARATAPQEFPDLAFPAQLNPGITARSWRPKFFDYLYLGFTNATAFSPTDVMPIARWAKLAMTVQAVVSLAILGLVIARAVNILK